MSVSHQKIVKMQHLLLSLYFIFSKHWMKQFNAQQEGFQAFSDRSSRLYDNICVKPLRTLYLNLTKPCAQRRHNTKLKHLSFSVWNAIFSDLCLFYLHNLVQLMCMIFRLLVTMKIYAYLPKDSDFYCCHCTCNFNTIKNSRYNCSGWRASCQARMTLHHFSQKAVF